MNVYSLFIGLLLSTLCSSALADTTYVKLKTAPQNGKESESTFTQLSSEAIDRGLRDATLLGKVTKKGNNTVITWDAITKNLSGTAAAKKLSSPLTSTLSTPAKSGDEIKVDGDLDAMLSDFDKMIDDSKETQEVTAEVEDSGGYLSDSGNTSGYSDDGGSSTDFELDADEYTVTYESCDLRLDFDTLTATEQEKEVKTSTQTGEVLEEGECQDTDTTYPILPDYQTQCTDLPDYENEKYYLGYRYFVDRTGTGEEKEYVSGCKINMDKPITIIEEVADCEATENLTTNVATINKKWYYDAKGQKVYVSECMASSETYPIVETENTCEPYVNEQSGTVITQTRKGWQDGDQTWHYVTECRASEESTEVPLHKEFSGELDHDWAGGVSYEMSRDYYLYEGEKVYVNETYTRDPSVSYPHHLTTEGCPVDNDDANLRSRLYEKTFIKRQNHIEVIKECEPSDEYVPYTNLGTTSEPWPVFNGSPVIPVTPGSDRTIQPEESCDYTQQFVSEQGVSFDYTIARGEVGYPDRHWCGGHEGETCYDYVDVTIEALKEYTQYRRFDDSLYLTDEERVCEVSDR